MKEPRWIKLSNGKFACVDDEDYERINKHKWCEATFGYAACGIRIDKNKQIHPKMHRMVMNDPKGLEVDHINHDPLDNRKENLRIVTRSQNQMNQKKSKLKGSTSKYKGVSYSNCPKHHKKPWIMQIVHNYKKTAKSCETEIEAALLYNKFAKEFFGEFALLNEVPQC